MAHFQICDCKPPVPGVNTAVCKVCSGYIDTIYRPMREKGEDGSQIKIDEKGNREWFEEKDLAIPPISEGDLRFADVQARVIMEWSDLIVDDVDDDGYVSYVSGWVMKVLPQQIVYNNHTTHYLASLQKGKPCSGEKP